MFVQAKLVMCIQKDKYCNLDVGLEIHVSANDPSLRITFTNSIDPD